MYTSLGPFSFPLLQCPLVAQSALNYREAALQS
jgi:hypothetical protein